jgi:hypothetical protein
MKFPLVRDLAAEGFPVRLTCEVLGFTAQAYYSWLANPVSDRDLHDAYLINALLDAHRDDPAFGYRFLADELEPAGITVGERRVWRLCSQQRLWSTTVRKGRRGKGKPGPAVHDDHVRRNFTAAEPNRTWVTDITEHPTGEGKVSCCAIKDLFSNRIVGYAIGDRMTADLAVSALRAAIARRQPEGVVIVHADRGSQGGHGPSGPSSSPPASKARWAGSPQPETTPRWNRSGRCCSATSWTPSSGAPAERTGHRRTAHSGSGRVNVMLVLPVT